MSYFNSGSYISQTPYHTKHRNHMKMFLLLIVMGVIVFNVFLVKTIAGKVKASSQVSATYKAAVKDYENGRDNYDIKLIEQAYNGFSEVKDYKDSEEYMNKISEEKSLMEEYEVALSNYETEDYAGALVGFHNLGNYRDSEKNIKTISDSLYSNGKSKMDSKEYDEARKLLLMIPEYADTYEDAQGLLASIDDKQESDALEKAYQDAVGKFNSEDYIGAQSAFIKIRDYSNSEDYIDQIGSRYYALAQDSYDNGDYSSCLEAISHIDSEGEWKNYNDALTLKDSFETEYKKYVEETARQKLDDEGYAAFDEFVNSSTNEFYSKNEADTLLNNYKPIYLCDMTAYDKGTYEDDPTFPARGTFIYDLYYEDYLYDEEGNCHKNCLTGGGSYLTYHLGGEYNTLSGNMFVLQDGQATIDRPVFLCVRDGDGNELYRESLYSGFGNKSISIDVTNVEDITIIFSGKYEGLFSSYWYGAIGELCLLK